MDNSPVILSSNISILENLLLLSKGLILIVTIAWFIMIIIKYSYKVVNDKEHEEINKVYDIFNDTLFSLVLAIIFLSSIITLYIFKNSWSFIFKHVLGIIGLIQTPKLTKVVVPIFHISVIWWVNIWILLVCILAIVSKITNVLNWILFVF